MARVGAASSKYLNISGDTKCLEPKYVQILNPFVWTSRTTRTLFCRSFTVTSIRLVWVYYFIPPTRIIVVRVHIISRDSIAHNVWNAEPCPWKRGKRALSYLRGPFLTRGEPFRLLLPPPRPPASTAPGEGLHGGLLDGSCGRRRRRGMRNRLNVGSYAPGFEYETLIRLSKAVWKKTTIVHTLTDKSMICAVSIINWLFAERP